MTDKKRQVTIKLDDKTKEGLSGLAFIKKCSIQDYIEGLIKDEIDKNADKLRALQELSEQGLFGKKQGG